MSQGYGNAAKKALTISRLFRSNDRPVIKTAKQGFECGFIQLFNQIQECWQHVIFGDGRELGVVTDVQSFEEELEGGSDERGQSGSIRLSNCPLEHVEEANQYLEDNHDQRNAVYTRRLACLFVSRTGILPDSEQRRQKRSSRYPLCQRSDVAIDVSVDIGSRSTDDTRYGLHELFRRNECWNSNSNARQEVGSRRHKRRNGRREVTAQFENWLDVRYHSGAESLAACRGKVRRHLRQVVVGTYDRLDSNRNESNDTSALDSAFCRASESIGRTVFPSAESSLSIRMLLIRSSA